MSKRAGARTSPTVLMMSCSLRVFFERNKNASQTRNKMREEKKNGVIDLYSIEEMTTFSNVFFDKKIGQEQNLLLRIS
jgi:hypothetical protein